MKVRFVLFLALFAVWLALSGHNSALLVGLGALSSLLVVLLSARLGIVDRESVFIHLARGLLTYAPWLIKEILLANLDVVKRILNPKLPIQPAIVRVPADQPTALGRVVYANSITLTPGTITLRLSGGVLLVHALSRKAAEGLRRGEMGRRVEALVKGSGCS